MACDRWRQCRRKRKKSGYPSWLEWKASYIDPEAVSRFNRIVDSVDPDIVISSAWRVSCTFQQIADVFSVNEIRGRLCDFTPRIPGTPRGFEIESWIAARKARIDRVCILDDESDMDRMQRYLVQTSWDQGIQDIHVNAVIQMLNGV